MTIIRQPTPTKFPNKKRAEISKIPARSVMLGSLSKPPPSASRPPHRDDFANDLNDLPMADPIVQFVVQ